MNTYKGIDIKKEDGNIVLILSRNVVKDLRETLGKAQTSWEVFDVLDDFLDETKQDIDNFRD